MDLSRLCKHKVVKDHSSFLFCRDCGSLIFNKISTIKPIRYNYRLEINPLIVLEKMILHYNSLLIDSIEYKLSELQIEKRREFIKILNKLVHKLKFRSQTFYLACFYFDYIIKFNKEIKIENAAIGSLILATKFDEIDSFFPDLFQFEIVSNKIFINIEDLKKSEIICLSTLNYRLNHFTSYHFINFFFSIGIVFTDDKVYIDTMDEFLPINYKIAEKVYDITKEVLLYFIEDHKFLEFNSLEIACSSISLARERMKLNEIWHHRFEEIYKIYYKDFQTCFEIMKGLITNLWGSNNKKQDKSKKNIKFEKNLENEIMIDLNSTSHDKKELISKNIEDKINLYNDMSNQKSELKILVNPKENILIKSSEEKVLFDNMNDNIICKLDNNVNKENKFYKDIKEHQLNIVIKTIREKNSRNEYSMDPPFNKKVKLSDDDNCSDLILRTKILLSKSNNYKNEKNKRPSTRNENNFNLFNMDRYQSILSRRNNQIIKKFKNQNNLEPKILCNQNDYYKYNFNYKKNEKSNFSKNYIEEHLNDSRGKIMIEYGTFKENNTSNKSENNDPYKKSIFENIYHKDSIKKKIDMEIYNIQRYKFNRFKSGINSYENIIPINNKEYDEFIQLVGLNQLENNPFYQYKQLN